MAGGWANDRDSANQACGQKRAAHCRPVLTRRLRSSYLVKALLATTALVAAGVPASAQTATWTGTTSFNWFDAGNWSPAAVPTALDAAVINTTTPRFPVISGGGSAVAASVNVGGVFDPFTQTTTSGDGVLFIQAGSSLTTTGGGLLG